MISLNGRANINIAFNLNYLCEQRRKVIIMYCKRSDLNLVWEKCMILNSDVGWTKR